MVDQILADEDDTGDVLWALTDNLGSVRDLVENDGTVANHITYDAYGNITSETDTSVDFIYAYTGRERDEESDLQFNRARYYDAAIGQWISEDPILFAAGDANPRRYIGNDPTNGLDPMGLQETSPIEQLRKKALEILTNSDDFKTLMESNAELAAAFQKAYEQAIKKFNAASLQLALIEFRRIRVLSSRGELRETVKKETGADYFGLPGLEGVFSYPEDTLYCNAEFAKDVPKVITHTILHELSHAIDGVVKRVQRRFSTSEKWTEIWKKYFRGDLLAQARIRGGGLDGDALADLWPKAYPLGPHATRNAQEGFAEFLAAALLDPKGTKEKFPEAYEYLRSNGLVE
jgi:RHS repeat-associated protein